MDLAGLPLGQGHPPTGDRRGKPWGLALKGMGMALVLRDLATPLKGRGLTVLP